METVEFDGSRRASLRGRSIGQRVSALLAFSIFTAVALVTAILVYSDVRSDFADRKRSFEATGYVFASALADHVGRHDTAESLRVLRSMSRIPEVTFAAVVDDKGKAFASFGSAVVKDTRSLRSDIGLYEAIRSGSYPVAVDIIKSGSKIGQVVLIADVSDLRSQIGTSIATGLGVALLAMGITFALARRLLARITSPIRSLTEAIAQVRSTGHFEAPLVTQAEGEAAVLVDSFNAMMGEIEARDAALEKHRQTLEATVEQRTNELRLARDAAESANQAKSSFLATMSHEIRTPLNGLMVMAELLAGAGLDQRLQRYAEVIVKSGQSLLTIINDVLDLSKIEAGRLDLESTPVCPASVADDVTSLFWEKASSKGLDLAARVAPGVPETVRADPVRLNQILSNLVNNALKFTERGQVLISLQYESGHLVMAVSDSGIGIPQKKLDQLFQAFSQADQTITRKFGGTGLGLAICKRLAEAMGGTIGVRSELGKGSTFWVRLPLPVETLADTLRLPPLRAALAVDGLASQSALGTALAAAGFEVRLAKDDVLDADVVFATADRLRGLDHGNAPRPRIICLGWIGDSRGETAIAQGLADDLMILPLRQQDMKDMIHRIHEGRLRGLDVLDRKTQERPSRTSFRGRRVLVADDNAVNREVIIEVLRQLDVAVEIALNGHEAVDKWKASRPDLVFMDCSMPEMDGYSATREIRAHEKLALGGGHTPVVALTAHVAGTSSSAWREAGMDAYMTKPFTLQQITGCLEAQFAGLPLDAPEEVGEAPAGSVLDPGVLADLRNIGGNTALFHRVLDLFAGRVPLAVETVGSLVTAGDRKAMADAAHALKSMCANIGASRAVGACHELERAARSDEDFDPQALMAGVLREVKLVMEEVERLRAV
jgi:signal transduction histidine kinase/DNA-binding NarL/FixJ family response regulator